MRKLIFLENGYECPSTSEIIEEVKDALKDIGLPHEVKIDEMEVIYQFRQMDFDKLESLLFTHTSDYVFVTMSMYTNGSDTDFLYLCAKAGRYNTKNIVYIDMSGRLPEFLNDTLFSDDGAVEVACAINSNNFLTAYYTDDMELRLRRMDIQFNEFMGECVVFPDDDKSISSLWK